VQDELIVVSPEAALELVCSDDEPGLARPDVKEECLGRSVVRTQDDFLQPFVELASVESPGDDSRDERRTVGT